MGARACKQSTNADTSSSANHRNETLMYAGQILGLGCGGSEIADYWTGETLTNSRIGSAKVPSQHWWKTRFGKCREYQWRQLPYLKDLGLFGFLLPRSTDGRNYPHGKNERTSSWGCQDIQSSNNRSPCMVAITITHRIYNSIVPTTTMP